MGTVATRWRLDCLTEGAAGVYKVLFLSCLWADLADTWVEGGSGRP